MIVMGYTLHLYCDVADCIARKTTGATPIGEFIDRRATVCWRQAREAGWKVYQSTGTAKCPTCARLNRSIKRQP
jgi:ketosteroid isomerase-like protein